MGKFLKPRRPNPLTREDLFVNNKVFLKYIAKTCTYRITFSEQ